MTYLKDLGFNDEYINTINENLPSKALETLEKEKEKVSKNINFLKDLGVKNYCDAFVKFYNMFLLENSSFEEIFSKYDREDLIAKLEKNVAIMEYL